ALRAVAGAGVPDRTRLRRGRRGCVPMGGCMSEANARLAWTALLVWACGLLALGAQLPGYSQAVHPVAMAGARGVPGAGLFNAMVFVLPGALVALVAWRLRAVLPAGAG